MLGTQIGYISQVSGSASVKDPGGVTRVVNVGDHVRDGDLLVTEANSSVVVAFLSGELLHVDAEASILLDESVNFEGGGYDDSEVDQVAALQQAILAGLDLTEIEPTAAGVEAAAASDSINSSISYERIGSEGLVDSRLIGLGGDGDSSDGGGVPGPGANNFGGLISDASVTPIAVGLQLNLIAGDDIINALESGLALVVSGVVSGAAASGDVVQVVIGGVTYNTNVNADNTTFSVSVPAAVVSTLTGGSVSASISGIDTEGNFFSADTSRAFTVDGSASASVSLGAIAADDIINALEAGNPLVISGTVGGDAASGDAVEVTIGGVTYNSTVNADNTTFSVTVPAAAVGTLVDGNATASVSGSDVAGNPFTANTSRAYTVDDSAAATVALNVIAGDDIINALESGNPLVISGTVGGDAASGDAVEVTIGGVTYNSTVNADNTTFSVTVPAAAVGTLVDGNATASVSGSDVAGNPFTANTSRAYTVDDSAAATVALNVIAGDDIINALESGNPLVISGTVGGDAASGDAVEVTIGGVTYNSTVNADNTTFSVTVPAAAVGTLVDGNATASVSGSDVAGNPFIANTSRAFTVDDSAAATVALNVIAGDDIINALESGNPLVISGTVGGDAASGDAVVVTIGGVTYNSTVNADNTTFSVTVPAAAVGSLVDGNATASVSGSDGAGNPFTANTSRAYTVDDSAGATVALNVIAGDDIINALESGNPLVISGTVGGDAASGDAVEVTIGGVTYNSTVNADNTTFSVTVPAAAVGSLVDGNATASVSGSDGAGNPFTANTSRAYTVDDSAGATVALNVIAGDDIINALESGNPLVISGTVGGDAASGDAVEVTIGGVTYNSTVNADNTTFSVTVPAAAVGSLVDGNATASVSGSDVAGNPFTANTSRAFTVDDSAAATVALNVIAGDDIINAVESGNPLVISGTVGGDAASGDAVEVTIGGVTYNSTVNADNTTFSVTVPAAAVGTLVDGNATASVSGSDVAGNPFTANTSRAFTVDDSAGATVALNVIAGDDIINALESGNPLVISGTVGGDAASGDAVEVTIGGVTYNSTVNADNTTFSVTVPAAAVGTLVDGNATASVSGSDVAGNPFTANTSRAFTVDDSAGATVALNVIAGDDIINALESGNPLVISGTVGGDAASGDAVEVTIGGVTYNSTVNADNTTFSVTVPAAAVGSLVDGNATASVSGSDVAGNPFTANTSRAYTVDDSAAATVALNVIAGDDIINALESGSPLVISGTVGGDAASGDAVEVTIGGVTYNSTVNADNTTFSVTVPAAAVGTLVDGNATASVSGSDVAGNPFTANTSRAFTVDDSAAATVALNVIAGDDIINALESGNPLVVSGTVGGDAASGDAVEVTIGGVTYNSTVNADNTTFSVTVPAAAVGSLVDGNATASVSGSDVAGNPFTANTSRAYTVDDSAGATVALNVIAGDDIINALESGNPLVISGTVGGDAASGDAVEVTIGGVTYNSTVNADNTTFSVTVPAAAVGSLVDGNATASVSGSDGAGNPFTANTSRAFTVDDSAAATVALNVIAGDDIINALESGNPLVISGTVGGDAASGDAVEVTIGGVTYNSTVNADNTTFSVTVPAAAVGTLVDGNATASVSGSDVAGNPFTANTSRAFTVDDSAAATVALNVIAGDDIINALESGNPLVISGTVGGDAASGDAVEVTIGGVTYNSTVNADNTTFSVTVPAAAVGTLVDGNATASVSGSDVAGNPFTANTSRAFTVDTVASATISVDNITDDDLVTPAEAAGNITVTGTVGGDATVGDLVSFTINGNDYEGRVLAGNVFSIDVLGADLAQQASFVATVAGSDDAGNPFTATATSTHQVSPALDLDGDVAGTGYVTSFTEGAYAVSVADSDITITDADSANIQGATITLTNAQAGDLLIVGALPAGISTSVYDPNTGVVSLSGTASLADYQLAIRAIQYENDGTVSGGSRTIDVVVTDGQNISNLATTQVNVSTIATVSIDDVLVREPSSGTVTMTFTVSLDEALASDLTFDFKTVDVTATSGADYQSVALTQGTIAAGSTETTISITVNSDSNIYEGDETFTVDLSNFNQTVNFTTSANTTVNGIQGIGTIGANGGAPNAVDDNYLTAENTPLLINDLLLNDTIVDGAQITGFTQGASGSVTDNGDGTFTYTPVGGFIGTDQFTYTLTDSDGETDTAIVSVTVGLNSADLPVVSNVPDISYTENDSATKILSGINISDADSNGLSSVVVRVSGYIPTQDTLAFVTAGTGIAIASSVIGNEWTATLTGGSDISEYLSVLETLTYLNGSENPSSAPRSITVEAYDQDFHNLFGADAGVLSIQPVNDAPDAFDNVVYVLDNSADNALNIVAPTDPDADDDLLLITVTGIPVALGAVTLADGSPVVVGDTLSLEQLTHLEFDAGALSGSGALTYDVFDGALTTSASTTIYVGETNADSGTVFESALANGTGEGSTLVSGNLLANDVVATPTTTIDSVNGVAPAAGVITIVSALGTLIVYADASQGHAAGDYQYQLNSPDGTSNNVAEAFTYSFTESGESFSETLTVTVADDAPIARDLIAQVSESSEQIFNVIITLDTSGSMNWSLYDNSAPPAGEPTRLDVSKDALATLASEFFNQSSQVTITLMTFAGSPTLVGTYSSLSDIEAAIGGLTAGGSTDYVDALDLLESEFKDDLDAQDPLDNVQNISYFISDGVSSSSPIGGGFDDFVNTHDIYSYAIGIGSSVLAGSADLNFIHNIDALQQGGTSDDAIFVENIAQLETELLNNMPVGFGGSLLTTGSVRNVEFGADDGYVTDVVLDINGTSYTFSYDGTAISVSPALAGVVIDGATFKIGPSVAGFTLGTFSFDFAEAEYTLSSPEGNAGQQLIFDYSVVDGDGDTASATATINIVDGRPIANDDLHTVDAVSVAEGNVINALGTDGGPTYGPNLSPFSTQGGGIDLIVDNADVTQMTFRGQVFDLDFSGTAPGAGFAGTLSWTYSLTEDVFGNEIAQVFVVDSSDNAQLTFNSQGYYKFNPDATADTEYSVNTTSQENVDAADFDITVRAGEGTDPQLGYNSDGVGVEGGYGELLDNDEAILVTFDSAVLPHGVRDLVLTFDDFKEKYDDRVTVIVTHDSDGDGVFSTDTVVFAAQTNYPESLDLSQYSSVTSVDIEYTGSGKESGLFNVSYKAQPSATPSALIPEVIGYTLTDADSQTDSAQLNIYNINNHLVGTSGPDSIAGGLLNDSIVGGDGNDILSGGMGSDVLSGGAGDDSLVGGHGLDHLSGGEGADYLSGGADADYLHGGSGDDVLDGGSGNDVLNGGSGNDQLFGGSGADVLRGGEGDDSLMGGAGNDELFGDDGADRLQGGSGDDVLTGGKHQDTFVWSASDKGTAINPANDVITDFEVGVGGDVLHLADILQGEENNPLTDYLGFQSDGNGGTIINIHANSGGSASPEQHITLIDVDLMAGGTVSNQDIINSLMAGGNLIVD